LSTCPSCEHPWDRSRGGRQRRPSCHWRDSVTGVTGEMSHLLRHRACRALGQGQQNLQSHRKIHQSLNLRVTSGPGQPCALGDRPLVSHNGNRDLHPTPRGERPFVSGYYRSVREPPPLPHTGEKTTGPKTWEEGAPYLPGFSRNPGCAAGDPGTQQLRGVAPLFAPDGISLTKVYGSAKFRPVALICFQAAFVCLTQWLSKVEVRLPRK